MVGLENKCALCNFKAVSKTQLLHHITGYHSWAYSVMDEMEKALYKVIEEHAYGHSVQFSKHE